MRDLFLERTFDVSWFPCGPRFRLVGSIDSCHFVARAHMVYTNFILLHDAKSRFPLVFQPKSQYFGSPHVRDKDRYGLPRAHT